jgi:Flp pilus assembly protein CpaB
MRAVNVSVAKTHAVGGLIQTGEQVDVFLTSRITDGSGAAPFVRTALLARDVKVVAKRDMLMTILASNPDDQPLSFTLQANPYRAALIEYASTSGTLSLVPRPKPRTMMMEMGDKKDPPKSGMPNFGDPESREYRDENERVAAIERGESSIGTVDLVRVFNLPELTQPKKVETPPPPMVVQGPPPVRVTIVKGVDRKGETIFGDLPPAPKPETKTETKPVKDPPRLGYRFYDMKAKINEKGLAGASEAECETCGKNEK